MLNTAGQTQKANVLMQQKAERDEWRELFKSAQKPINENSEPPAHAKRGLFKRMFG